jgi:hypothetical protein
MCLTSTSLLTVHWRLCFLWLQVSGMVVRRHFRDPQLLEEDRIVGELAGKNQDELSLVLFSNQTVADFHCSNAASAGGATGPNMVRFHVTVNTGDAADNVARADTAATLVSLDATLFEGGGATGHTFAFLTQRLAQAVGHASTTTTTTAASAALLRIRVYDDERCNYRCSSLWPDSMLVASTPVVHRDINYVALEPCAPPATDAHVVKVQYGPIILAATGGSSSSGSSADGASSADGDPLVRELILPSATHVRELVEQSVAALGAGEGPWHLQTISTEPGERNSNVDDVEATLSRAKVGYVIFRVVTVSHHVLLCWFSVNLTARVRSSSRSFFTALPISFPCISYYHLTDPLYLVLIRYISY